MVWGSPDFAAAALNALSYAFEGPQRIAAALSGISAMSIFAVVHLAFIATLLGYGSWSRLLSRYPASRSRRFRCSCRSSVSHRRRSFSMSGSPPRQIAGAVLVMVRLAVNVFGGWVVQRLSLAR